MLSNNKKFFLVALVIGSFVLIICTVILANSSFSIRNTSPLVTSDNKILNTISVSGEGKVSARPDMATFTLSFSELAETSSDAISRANERLNQARQVILSKGVPERDIQTNQISIYPEYDYSRDGEARLKGQRASVGLTVKVKSIDEKATKVTEVLDEITKINNIQLGGISFSIEDQEELMEIARADAFKKAEAKAKQLASLAGVGLSKPVGISDSSSNISLPPIYKYELASLGMDSRSSSSEISTGELEVVVNLSVIWGME